MLKRNGQLCEHSVPDYSGRLTDSEFEAYKAVFGTVETEFNELSAITQAVAQMEKSLPEFLDKISTPGSQSLDGQDGAQWKVVAPLPDSQHGEMFWCKRQLGDMEEFAIVERFDPNSPLAAAQGEFDVQMTDTDPMRLLRDFINARRDAAQLFANDIVTAVQQQTSEKYPGEDLNRVVEAISHRCSKKISPEQTVSSVEARRRSEGMHV